MLLDIISDGLHHVIFQEQMCGMQQYFKQQAHLD